jgi:hypothetical protein
MRSEIELVILAMIQNESACRSVGDASVGTLFVDLSFERNAPMGIDDAKAVFASFGIEHDESDAEWLAETLTPAAFAAAGTPSYCYLIASLDNQGYVNWGKFSTRDELDRAWTECEEQGGRYECEEC